MNTDKFTPGPWSNDPLQPTIWDASGDFKIATIAELPWKNGKSDWMTEQANARLIAAAPDLLAALQVIIKRGYKLEAGDYAAAVDAIAKAEGRV